MEVVLNRDAFLKGLQMVQNIVEPRQTLPILANVLLETDGEAVRLTATDLEVGARVAVPARVAGKGAITVSARKLAEIVKELPAADVAVLRARVLLVRSGTIPKTSSGKIQRSRLGEMLQTGALRGQLLPTTGVEPPSA